MPGAEGHSGQSKRVTVQITPGGPLARVRVSVPAERPLRLYLRCLKPCEPSGPSGCRITLLGCLVSSGCEIRGGLRGQRGHS